MADSTRGGDLALRRSALRALVVEVLGLLVTEAELRRLRDDDAVWEGHLDHHVLVGLLLLEALRHETALQQVLEVLLIPTQHEVTLGALAKLLQHVDAGRERDHRALHSLAR